MPSRIYRLLSESPGEQDSSVLPTIVQQVKRKPVRSSAIDSSAEDEPSFHRRSHAPRLSLSLGSFDFADTIENDPPVEQDIGIDTRSTREADYELSLLPSQQTGESKRGSEATLLLDRVIGEDDPPPPYSYANETGARWWMPRMLVNRTLRGMAALMVLFATMMFLTSVTHLQTMRAVISRGSTSVPFNNKGEPQSCDALEAQSLVLHLAINVVATIVLGISNTYQMLVTSLKASEIRWALSKFRDVRVGTNSPSNINRKKTGKGSAWCIWALLISTSLPVHLLANSIIGPALVYTAPKLTGIFDSLDAAKASLEGRAGAEIVDDFAHGSEHACYEAFRTGNLGWGFGQAKDGYGSNGQGNLTRFSGSKMSILFTPECEALNGTGDYKQARSEYTGTSGWYGLQHIDTGSGNPCYPRFNVTCLLAFDADTEEKPPLCRLQIRMQATLILMSCLVWKAVYMVLVNFRSRHKPAQKCLTFGDILAASVVESGLKIRNECLVNAGESFRQRVSHSCHPHCSKDAIQDDTGDTLGHCQKCTKFNQIDKAADLPQPALATKYKRPLLTSLGMASIIQMLILTTCSMTMFGLSIYLAVVMGTEASNFDYYCYKRPNPNYYPVDTCEQGKYRHLWRYSGEFGGFQSSIKLGSLPQDQLSSEIITFFISNGTQLIYSAIYLLLIYNISLISMEHHWGKLDKVRKRPRCTLVRGAAFDQSYFMQLPRNIIVPIMVFSATVHWLLGQAISTKENVYLSSDYSFPHSQYDATFAMIPFWLATVFMIFMTFFCWWAFTYTREGFIPQMYGSMRVLCASTTELYEFGREGVTWGEMIGKREARLAGFSSGAVDPIQPNKFYPGVSHED